MQKLIYPENVLDLIFGVKSEHAWTELNRNRQEAITLLEGAFFSFLQAESINVDKTIITASQTIFFITTPPFIF